MQFSENIAVAQTISVLLFDNFSNHCLANTVEPFRAANTIARAQLYSWQFLSFEGGTVTSSSGLSVETGCWSKLQPAGDFLFVMPSYGFRDLATPRAGQALRVARARFETLVGFDTGAWMLAAAGLLEGRRATIHWDELTSFAEAFPQVDTLENRFVLEPDLATCGGAATAFELALELIKLRYTPMFALEVAALFMHGDKLETQDPIERRSSDALVRSATALMRRTIEDPLSLPQLSSHIKVEQRLLEDVFRAEMRMTPQAVYKAIRLREARRLVVLTRLGIVEIAERCGYRNASAMTRAYRSEFGHTPSTHRKEKLR